MCCKCLYLLTMRACLALSVLFMMNSNEMVDQEMILQMCTFWCFFPEELRHLQRSATSFSACSSYQCLSTVISSFHICFSFAVVFKLVGARILLTHWKLWATNFPDIITIKTGQICPCLQTPIRFHSANRDKDRTLKLTDTKYHRRNLGRRGTNAPPIFFYLRIDIWGVINWRRTNIKLEIFSKWLFGCRKGRKKCNKPNFLHFLNLTPS